jgi:hypothetical protein
MPLQVSVLLSMKVTAYLWRVGIHHIGTAMPIVRSETENEGDETHNEESM